MDPKLGKYIKKGTMAAIQQFRTVLDCLKQESSTARHLKRMTTPSRVFPTSDFLKTVKLTKGSFNDEYFRPINWTLASKDKTFGPVLVLPEYEVYQCMPSIRSPASKVNLISYEPRVTRSMPSIESSLHHPLEHAKDAWHSLTPFARQQLHLLAGQLYFTTFEEYELWMETLRVGDGGLSLGFVREWMGVRRKGQHF